MKIISLLMISLMLVTANAFAAPPAGQVILAIGSLEAIAPNKASRTLQRGNPFYQSDTLVTGSRTQAKIRFTDGTLVTLSPNTRIRVDSYHYQASGGDYLVSLTAGGFRTVSGAIAQQNPDAYKVRTPVATIAIRGTDYSVLYTKAQGLVASVWEGKIALTNEQGTLIVGPGEDFRYAQIKSMYAIPEGLTKPPAALANTPEATTTTTTTTSSSTSTTLAKSPMLEICIP